jgi:hypothetical protein
MPGLPAKLHLPFAEWPEADKMLWQQVETQDPFAPGCGTRLSAATLARCLFGWRRFLGFLAIEQAEALDISRLNASIRGASRSLRSI